MLSGTESSILLLQFCFSNKPWASHYQFPPKAAKHKKKKKKKIRLCSVKAIWKVSHLIHFYALILTLEWRWTDMYLICLWQIVKIGRARRLEDLRFCSNSGCVPCYVFHAKSQMILVGVTTCSRAGTGHKYIRTNFCNQRAFIHKFSVEVS